MPSKSPDNVNRASPPTIMNKRMSQRASSVRSLGDPTGGSRSPSPIELSTKFGVHSADRKASTDYAQLTHLSGLSKLKAAAEPGDFRLSDFNLERIHR